MMNRFVALPRPLQAGLMLAAGGSLVGVLYMLLHGRALFILMIGIAVVAGLLILYRVLLKRSAKRKAARMEKGMSEHASGGAVAGAPAERARMDDLRRSFDDGVAKFKAAGKNLYEHPWYVMVGESGSGKTEAIRHSSIGFPPGLQDKLQGAGGTINMHWWFAEDAVLLDTAGRMMFEESGSGEWREFLKLLHTHRGNCPINGMLLAIPADTLITDGAEDIERKGTLIAQQLDQIQRELGVRFPVFVIVTKCDLVTGFREFFDGLHDPELQHQLLGWSNPDSLDEPFNPSLLDEHIKTVTARLKRRRLRILMDPPDLEEARSRADRADALYAFPASLDRLMPRLKRYLEMAFVAGSWTAKPLFLRGIYFTSSMREGSALDEDLAEMVGVPVESLPEGQVWAQERAFFLRDVFTAKAFRERGLVTRAVNAGRVRRIRRAIVLGFGFFSALLILACTWLGARAMDQSVGTHRDFWVDASRIPWSDRPIVEWEFRNSPAYEYRDSTTVSVDDVTMTLPEFYDELLRRTEVEIRIPRVFRLAASFGADIDTARIEAHRAILTASAMRPLVEAARHKIVVDEASPWSLPATQSLVTLLRLEAQYGGASMEDLPSLDPLFEYVLRDKTEYARYADGGDETLAGAKILAGAMNFSFASEAFDASDRGWGWLCPALAAAESSAQDAAAKGVDRFIAHWASVENDQAGGVDAALRKLIEELFPALADDMAAATGLETRLLALPGDLFGTEAATAPASLADRDEAVELWREAHANVLAAAGELTSHAAAIQTELAALADHTPAAPAAPAEAPAKKGLLEAGSTLVKTGLTVAESAAGDDVAAPPAAPAGNWVDQGYRLASSVLADRSLRSFEGLLDAIASGTPPDQRQAEFLERLAEKLTEAKGRLAATIVNKPLEARLTALGGDFYPSVSVAANKALGDIPARLGEPWSTQLADLDEWSAYQIRLMMYALVDEQLSAVDEAVEPAALPGAIKTIEDEIDGAAADIGNLWVAHGKAVSPAAGAYFAEADKLTSFALRCAKRGRVYTLLAESLGGSARMATVQGQVEEAAGDEDDPLPELPMTAFAGADALTVPRRYAPEAAKGVLEGWRTAGSYVRDAEDVIERDKLLKRMGRWEAACQDYVADYYAYWTEGVGENLRPDPESWSSYQAELKKVVMRHLRVCRDLKELSKRVREALDAVGPYGDDEYRALCVNASKQLAAAGGRAGDSAWRSDARSVLRAWRKLTDDVVVARRRLQRLEVDDFVNDYMSFVNEEDDPVVKRYMMGIVLGGLAVLAEESQSAAYDAWRQFRRDAVAFPFVRPQESGEQLTSKELAEVAVILDRIGGSAPRAEQGRLLTIGEGGETGFGAIDEQLPDVRGLRLSDQGQKLIDVVRMIANAAGGEDRKAGTISVAGREDQDGDGEFFYYYAGGIRVLRESRSRGSRVGNIGDDPKRLCEAEYAAGAEGLRMEVYRQPGDDEPAHTITLQGPWAPIRLLHRGEVVEGEGDDEVRHTWETIKRDRDKKTWLVKATFAVGGGAAERSIVLQVRFEDELPRITDWPTESNFEAVNASIRR